MLTRGSGGSETKIVGISGRVQESWRSDQLFFGVRELVRGGVRGFQLLDVSSSGCKRTSKPHVTGGILP